jgi:hypothetical protein
LEKKLLKNDNRKKETSREHEQGKLKTREKEEELVVKSTRTPSKNMGKDQEMVKKESK